MSKITKDSLLLKTRIRKWNTILKDEDLLKYDMTENKKTAKSVSAFLKDCIIKNEIDIDSIWADYLKDDSKLILELLSDFNRTALLPEKDREFAIQTRVKMIKNLNRLANEYREVNEKKYTEVVRVLALSGESKNKHLSRKLKADVKDYEIK